MKKYTIIGALSLVLALGGCNNGYYPDGNYSPEFSNAQSDFKVLDDPGYRGTQYKMTIVDCSSLVELVARANKYGAQGWQPAGPVDRCTLMMFKAIPAPQAK